MNNPPNAVALGQGSQPADPTAQLLYQLVGTQMLQKLIQEHIAQLTPDQRATLNEALYQRMLAYARGELGDATKNIGGSHGLEYGLQKAVDQAMLAVAGSVAAEAVAATNLREQYAKLVQHEIEHNLASRVRSVVAGAMDKVLGTVAHEIKRLQGTMLLP